MAMLPSMEPLTLTPSVMVFPPAVNSSPLVGVLLKGLCDPKDGVRGVHFHPGHDAGQESGRLVPESGLEDRGRGPLEAGAGGDKHCCLDLKV